MNDIRLTPENFDRDFRRNLFLHHDFEPRDLDRAKEIIGDAIEHVTQKTGTRHSMTAEHLDTALKFLNTEHAGWKKLPEHQRSHLEAALREHFGITEK